MFQKQPLIRQCCFPWELIQFCNCPWVEGILVVIPNGCRLFHENSASQTSFVAIFPYSHPYLNFAKSRFPGSSQIPYLVSAFPNPALSFGQVPYSVSVFPNRAQCFGQIPDPVTVSRIPHCLLVKSRIPLAFSRIPHCLLVKSRIPGYPWA